ncbi:hypothetical protein SAMN06297129_3170 [Pseudooceanicola antarcticus]|uniref:Gene transfer agent protein n=1 Tax=Pseudooceanicola antarcticus TaxID=1247613 RepID=A0A285J7I2_9RHOB|nr:hypothetical protein [Pseudooceanicola antarcticus]PJE27109.1 hypothetical protein CVM39_16785 [Pseudooceanicola antarcticus]SNY56013.1 hypothetical protein SAMN06297129_3170 [Pseudooceanicola antarcticus]
MSELREIRRSAGYEEFQCGPALRLDAHERLSGLQIEALNARIDRIEQLLERLEKRLWLIVFGVVGVVLAEAFQSVIDKLP